jgi:hypothetical protein
MASGEDFLDRVEREWEQHLLPVYHPRDVFPFSRVVQAVKARSAKLPFDNLQDAGACYAALVVFFSNSSSSTQPEVDALQQLSSMCGVT